MSCSLFQSFPKTSSAGERIRHQAGGVIDEGVYRRVGEACYVPYLTPQEATQGDHRMGSGWTGKAARPARIEPKTIYRKTDYYGRAIGLITSRDRTVVTGYSDKPQVTF